MTSVWQPVREVEDARAAGPEQRGEEPVVEREPSLAEAYLGVLGVDPASLEGGSSASLTAVHRAHALRFGHDTVWMSRGRMPQVHYETLVGALLAGEGGACVNLNASLAWLLRQLGFEVELHRARVVQGFDDRPSDLDAHLVLRVQTEDGPWLADVGLGAGLLEPLPMREGRYEQGSYTFVLEESEAPMLSHRLRVDRRLMGVRSIEWEAADAALPAFEAAYVHDSSDPASPYVQHLTAHIRTEVGSSMLNARVLTMIEDRRPRIERITTADRWEEVLREVFKLALPEMDHAERQGLWDKTGEVAVVV